MSLGRDKTRERVQGGGTLEMKLSTAASWDDIGYLSESEVEDNADVIKIPDETGDIHRFTGQREVLWNTVLMQSYSDEIKLLRDAEGKTYNARYKVQFPNGKWQAWTLGATCEVQVGVKLGFKPGQLGSIPMTLKLNKGASLDIYYDMTEATAEPSASSDWPTVN